MILETRDNGELMILETKRLQRTPDTGDKEITKNSGYWRKRDNGELRILETKR